MVPEGWRLATLGELCDGRLQTGPFGSQLHANEYVSEGVAILMPKDLIGCRASLKDAAKISVEKADELSKHKLYDGDILFSRRGEVSRFALIDSQSEGALCGTGCLKARPSMEFYPGFVSYFLQLSSVRRWLEQNAVGQTMPNLNTTILSELPLMVPNFRPEQVKIAKILSTWDEAIATTEQLLANSEQQKKALMQQLLTGKKRLPGFEGEWFSAKMGDVFRRVTTKNDGQSANVVTISGKQGLIRQQEFFKKSIASEFLDGYFLLKKGQFAYNKSYSKGYPMGAVKRLNRYPEAVVTTLYICFEIADEKMASGDYLEHYFEAGFLNHGLSKVANEGGRAHGLLNVKPADFFSLSVSLPNLDEQKAIAKVIASAEKEVQELEKDLSLLQKQKKALMQQLLTGKRRVKVDEAERATA